MIKPVLYYDLRKEQLELAEINAAKNRKDTKFVDFLLQRRANREAQFEVQRQAMHPDDVAKLTMRMLGGKATLYYNQLSTWRPQLRLRRIDRTSIVDHFPHLGYASITGGTTPNSEGIMYPWVFYFCNFKAKFGVGDFLFEQIEPNYGITFFGLALTQNPDGTIGGRDLTYRGNGLLFATKDPMEAFENVSRLCDMKRLWSSLYKIKRQNIGT